MSDDLLEKLEGAYNTIFERSLAKRAAARIRELEAKVLRVVRGEFGQICSYCGWETPASDGAWDELQAHIKVCPSHPLTAERKAR